MIETQVWSHNIPIPVDTDGEVPVSHPDPCPDCGNVLILKKTGIGYWYRCALPSCDGNAGANDIGRPAGIAIDKAGRAKRMEAHDLFDPLWLSAHGSDRMSMFDVRDVLYEYLGLYVENNHFGEMNHDELDKALELLRSGAVKRYANWILGIQTKEGDDYGKTEEAD